MRHVAVHHVVASALLAAAAAALVLHVVGLGWPDGLGVGAFGGLGEQRRTLVQAAVEAVGSAPG